MEKEYIIIYDAHHNAKNFYYLNIKEAGIQTSQNINFVEEDSLIVTPDIEDCIREIDAEKIRNINILDFECLDKQLSQEGRDSSRDFSSWTVESMLKAWLPEEYFNQIDKYVANKDVFNPEEILCLLLTCYLKMRESDGEEWERINKIELKVNKVLYSSQKEGIKVKKKEELKKECEETSRIYYSAMNHLQEMGCPILDSNVILQKHGIDESVYDEGFDHIRKLRSYTDKIPEINHYIEAYKAKRYLNILLKFSNIRKTDKIHPVFKPFGTISSRIILRDPAIQYLPKDKRNLLKVEGCSYVYIDYSMFEVGIFCSLFDRKKLKDLYNNNDVYTELSNRIFSDGNNKCEKSGEEKREAAKEEFYKFLYGGLDIKEKFKHDFFDEYCKIEEIKEKLNNKIKGIYVSSKLGNKRRIVDDNAPRWLLNHIIQSTASLIFKEAIITVDDNLGKRAKLILPMHDAVLYSIDAKDNKIKDDLIECFKKAYKKWIEDVEPKVEIKNFF